MQVQYTTQDTQNQPLVDLNSRGEARPWKERRESAEMLAEIYDYLSAQSSGPASVKWAVAADRARSCGINPTFEIHRLPEGKKLTLHSAYFCRDRLCPLCQWRRSLKVGAQARAVVDQCNAIKQSRDGVPYGWIMLTLTQKSCSGAELSAELDRMHKALKLLTKSTPWKAAIKGWLRTSEITRNTDPKSKSYMMYHPHIHIVAAVNKSYFSGKDYIKQADWCRMWAAYMHLDYKPECEVHRIKERPDDKEKGSCGLSAAIAEVTKYCTKPASVILPDDIELSADSVATLSAALRGRRLAGWGGICKEAAALLALDDMENGDLIHLTDEPSSASSGEEGLSHYIEYGWRSGARNYYPVREFDAPASWAAAGQRRRENLAAAEGRRINEARIQTENQRSIAAIRAVVGDRAAKAIISNHDAFQIGRALRLSEEGEKND